MVFLLLIVAGAIILLRRNIDWTKVITENSWIWIYFAFGALSITWSDFPAVAGKRWIKALGNVVMALIVLTECRPYQAIGALIRRLGFVLLPLSFLFINYYPALGRAYHMGQPMFTGVSTNKNGLGQTCLIVGIFIVWRVLQGKSGARLMEPGRLDYRIVIVMLGLVAWLLDKANSATSLVCLIVGLIIMGLGSRSWMRARPKRIFNWVVGGSVFIWTADAVFDVQSVFLRFVGRRPDLTTRVPMWEDLLSLVENPMLGFGFESFWLGTRQQIVSDSWGIALSAHNGYIEMYLHLGMVGLLILLIWMVWGFLRVRKYLEINYLAGLLRLCLVVVVMLYNWTESTFYALNNMWVLFLLGVMAPQAGVEPRVRSHGIPQQDGSAVVQTLEKVGRS